MTDNERNPAHIIAFDDVELTSSDDTTLDGEPSPLWLLAFAGIALTGLAAFVIYETLSLFSTGIAAWADCARGSGVPLEACGGELDFVFQYRYGLDALSALLAAIFAAFVGPIPMIVMLNRFKNNYVGGLLFLLVMLPYGLLAFFVITIAALVLIFYGVELA
ncbi:MAG: hypothetical protein AAF125_01270 [Chloroflexota bacterium]